MTTDLEIGAKAEDGWTYIGISDTTGRDMFMEPDDAECLDYHDAVKKAKRVNREKGNDLNVRVPSIDELRQAFNGANLPHTGKYWSSTDEAVDGYSGKRVIITDQENGIRANTRDALCRTRLVRDGLRS